MLGGEQHAEAAESRLRGLGTQSLRGEGALCALLEERACVGVGEARAAVGAGRCGHTSVGGALRLSSRSCVPSSAPLTLPVVESETFCRVPPGKERKAKLPLFSKEERRKAWRIAAMGGPWALPGREAQRRWGRPGLGTKICHCRQAGLCPLRTSELWNTFE